MVKGYGLITIVRSVFFQDSRSFFIRASMNHATAQISDNTSACSSTVWVAFSCLSGG